MVFVWMKNKLYICTMKKKKDVFTKVEADARKMLEHPETAGAAKTVLEYIAEQRDKTKNWKTKVGKQ